MNLFNKREKHLIISLLIQDSCFCTSIEKGHPFSKQGSDLLLTEVQDRLYSTNN